MATPATAAPRPPAPPGGRIHPGLTAAEAAAALERHGPNALPKETPRPLLLRWLLQFKSPLIYVLLVAVAIDLVVWFLDGAHGVPLEAVAIAVVLALNATLEERQEGRASRALAALAELAAPRARVRRDGAVLEVATAEVVPGDLVALMAGDHVPADGVLVEAQSIALDESALTGESLPIARQVGERCASGTLVARGQGWLEVDATGEASTLGQLSARMRAVKVVKTPLERYLAHLGRQVAWAVGALAVVLVVATVATRGMDALVPALVFAAALAVAAIPEGLPAVLTLTLALGVERMARRRAVVRRLPSVEALGSVTLILTDKTGTLTENRMEVRAVESPDPERAWRVMVLAGETDPNTPGADPVDVALESWVASVGGEPEAIRQGAPLLERIPFDAESRSASVVVDAPEGPVRYLKGAPSVVLEACGLTGDVADRIRTRVDAVASQGERVLALAAGPADEGLLDWLGLVRLWDPPRPEVPDAIAGAQRAGIRVVMVTGDHPATARAIARTVGIDGAEPEAVLTGHELDALEDGVLAERLAHVAVCARTRPEQKLRLVERLQAMGEVVAMTGDGVNDVLALKRADVGIAMGLRGTDVAREAASLILLDDNFATIVAAVEEGRNIYANIQKFVRFLFTTNLSEVWVVVLGMAWLFFTGAEGARLVVPLTALQILWINLVTDAAPALVLALDENPAILSARPRDRDSRLLDGPQLRFVFAGAVVLSLVSFGAWLLAWYTWGEETVARTALFEVIVILQLLMVYPARGLFDRGSKNRWLHWTVWVTIAVQLALLATPFTRRVLELAVPG